MKRILSIVITAILAGAFAFTGLAPASASPRTGALDITKECSQYAGQTGGFCTITESNLKMIQPGSRVIYLGAANFEIGLLDTYIYLDTGPGNQAFGHVVLNLGTGTGTVTFNGGTGQFRHFQASAVVAYTGDADHPYDWGWEGTYSFSPDD